jgi:tetratricopeptide (TPR) repeat protein
VEAIGLWTEARMPEAEAAMRAHVRAHPRDLAIIQRLYFVLFWQGKFPAMLDLTTALLPHHSRNSSMMGMHAFALEEAGQCVEAVRLAEAALGADPEDAWSVHALAHALYEAGEFDAGVAALPRAIEPCRGLNWFRNHLWWHLTLLHLSRGEYARVSELSRQFFEREPSSIPGDLHDAISLLWRLELAARPVGERWQPFAAIARDRIARPGLLFHAAHLTMALVGAGDGTAADQQLARLRERGAHDSTGLTSEVLVPLCEGLRAFGDRDYARTIGKIEPLRPRMIELGGSRAQRDVFHDTLLEACFRAGDLDRAERLLVERIARRPDHFWVHRR